jgi:hypothetical protein
MLDEVNSLVSGATEVPGSHFTSLTNFESHEPSIAERMAGIIIARSKDAQPTCQGDLKAAGFSAAEIGAHFPAASQIATRTVIRQDGVYPPGNPWDQDPAYRAERIKRGAALIAGLCPSPGDINTVLRTAGFATREVGDLWPELIQAAGEQFHADRVRS